MVLVLDSCDSLFEVEGCFRSYLVNHPSKLLPLLGPDVRRCLGDGFLHVVVGVYHVMTELMDANKKSSTSCLKSPKTPEMCVFPLNVKRVLEGFTIV